MTYYRTCPHCGSNLDPGETCDCAKQWAEPQESQTTEKTHRPPVQR